MRHRFPVLLAAFISVPAFAADVPRKYEQQGPLPRQEKASKHPAVARR